MRSLSLAHEGLKIEPRERWRAEQTQFIHDKEDKERPSERAERKQKSQREREEAKAKYGEKNVRKTEIRQKACWRI